MNDTAFDSQYVELVALEADSVDGRLRQLAHDFRASARQHRSEGNIALANQLSAGAAAYTHAAEMLDLAWEQAMTRVAQQVSA